MSNIEIKNPFCQHYGIEVKQIDLDEKEVFLYANTDALSKSVLVYGNYAVQFKSFAELDNLDSIVMERVLESADAYINSAKDTLDTLLKQRVELLETIDKFKKK